MTVHIDETAWRKYAATLVAELTNSGILTDPRWREAFEQTPRHVFVPRFLRRDETTVDNIDPATTSEYLEEVYSDLSLVVQQVRVARIDIPLPTSSSTMPSLMARMLELLDVTNNSRVLEIGTATGYNAALLCHRLGSDQVTSIELHSGQAATAAEHLHAVSYHPTLAVGDGADGVPTNAPYDRILATCAVPAIPPSWIDQLAIGGRIVTDLRGEMSSSLAVLDKTAPGIVQGQLLEQPGHFMWLRTDPEHPLRDLDRYRYVIDLDEAVTTSTDLDPRVLDDPGLRVLLGILEPTLSAFAQRDNDDAAPNWSMRAAGGSWVKTTGHTVVQGGPRRIWPSIERAVSEWHRLGRPQRGQYGLTATADGRHQYWIDTPDECRIVDGPTG
jgi:protein-L-isoaspartate(D-aspartate) O-methyltransferase